MNNKINIKNDTWPGEMSVKCRTFAVENTDIFMNTNFEMVAKTFGGLEGVLAEELTRQPYGFVPRRFGHAVQSQYVMPHGFADTQAAIFF